MLNRVLFVSQIGTLFFVIAFSMQVRDSMAEETQLSDGFAMVMRPPADGVEIDKGEAEDIENFFHQAERAIQSENIDTLMALYSDEYTNQRDGDTSPGSGRVGRVHRDHEFDPEPGRSDHSGVDL